MKRMILPAALAAAALTWLAPSQCQAQYTTSDCPTCPTEFGGPGGGGGGGVVVSGRRRLFNRGPRANRVSENFAAVSPWHGGYYHWQWGQPLALVVPPTANTRGSLSWGVGQTEVNNIHHQFKRSYPGDGGDFSQFQATPYWPSHTDQFGVYYIRGPWGHR
jgi:hypothetical protein